MKKIYLSDVTLCQNCNENGLTLSFKEKIEIAKQLDKMNVDCIEIDKIENVKTDTLLIDTIAPIIKNSAISIAVNYSKDDIDAAWNAVKGAKHPRLRLSVPVSSVQMEYQCHKKPAAMLDMISELTSYCKQLCNDVEFCAQDATRSEPQYLYKAIAAAIEAGATCVTLCDSAGLLLPDELKAFIAESRANVSGMESVDTYVMCSNSMHMATACSIAAATAGVAGIKVSVSGKCCARTEAISEVIRSRGDSCDIYCSLNITELNRCIKQIEKITQVNFTDASTTAEFVSDLGVVLDSNDDMTTVSNAVKQLGYDLTEEDYHRVYEEFCRVAEKKAVSLRELEAIVASSALQVPPTYKVISYLINSGNITSASAHIKLEKNGAELEGVGIGDGPIDAAFETIEQIIGHHYELDDFQIQSVTQGREAVGNALVRLRHGGKLYSGNGISTDIIGASIRAYINALNKIVYEEA